MKKENFDRFVTGGMKAQEAATSAVDKAENEIHSLHVGAIKRGYDNTILFQMDNEKEGKPFVRNLLEIQGNIPRMVAGLVEKMKTAPQFADIIRQANAAYFKQKVAAAKTKKYDESGL